MAWEGLTLVYLGPEMVRIVITAVVKRCDFLQVITL